MKDKVTETSAVIIQIVADKVAKLILRIHELNVAPIGEGK
jgi:hypothetical protein